MSTSQDQLIEIIPVDALLQRVTALHERGSRLVQISATLLPEQLELTYSFEDTEQLINLRLHLPATDARIPSISSIYWCAFLYKNEMHDLFNLQVEGMAVDFHGNLYRTAVKYAFGTPTVPASGAGPNPTVAASTS